MPTLNLTGEVARGLADAVPATLIDTPEITPEQVLALPSDVREKILAALLEEVIREHNGGHGLIPLDTSDGRSFGYMVPPEAAMARYERFISKFPKDVQEQMRIPIPNDIDLNQTFDLDEFLNERQQVEAA